jgi:hypothetical protein
MCSDIIETPEHIYFHIIKTSNSSDTIDIRNQQRNETQPYAIVITTALCGNVGNLHVTLPVAYGVEGRISQRILEK